jgi:hypothetical protein
MDPVTAFAVLSLSGDGITAYGQIQESRDKAKMLNRQEGNLRIQAYEMLRRADIEKQRMTEEAAELKGTQAAMLAEQGLSGSNLALLAETAGKMVKEKNILEQQVAFDFGQMMEEADMLGAEARSTRKAGRIKALGTILSGGAGLAKSQM